MNEENISAITNPTINKKHVKVLTHLFEAGFVNEKDILAVGMEQIQKIRGISVTDIGTIVNLQKAIKANRVISFLVSGESEHGEA